MAHYQLLRPTPVTVYPRRFRRQAPAPSGTPAASGVPAVGGEEEEEEEEEEVEEGPESPDSPGSSSDEGGVTSGDESDSESEEDGLPSPAESGVTGSQSIGAAPTAISGSPTAQSSTVGAPQAPALGGSITSNSAAPPVNTIASDNGPGNNAALPQITGIPSGTRRTQIAIISSSSAATQVSTAVGGIPAGPAQSDTRGEAPQKSAQQRDGPIISRTAAVAATVLGVLGMCNFLIINSMGLQYYRCPSPYHRPCDLYQTSQAQEQQIPPASER